MGLNLEDWLTIWISNNIKSAPVRKLFAQNEYEKALELVKAYEEKTKTGRKGIGWMRKIEIGKSKIQKIEKFEKIYMYMSVSCGICRAAGVCSFDGACGCSKTEQIVSGSDGR